MTLLISLLAALGISGAAHAGTPDTGFCRNYSGNWVGAPHHTCDALPVGNGGRIEYVPVKKPHTVN